MKILIGTNTFGRYLRQDIAVDSLKYLREVDSDVDILDVQFYDERETFTSDYDIPVKYKLECSSRDWCRGDRYLPVISDILYVLFQEAEEKGYEYFGFVNSDIIVMPNLIEHIKNSNVNSLVCSRLDIEPIDSFQKVKDRKIKPVRWEPAGFDLFMFKTQWFGENMDYILKGVFFIGMPVFDVLLAGRMLVIDPTCEIHNQYPPKIFHIHHENKWANVDSPEKKWNMDRINDKDATGDALIINMMFYHLQTILCKRIPFGSFLNIPPEEQEQTKNFFKIMNIKVENQIRRV